MFNNQIPEIQENQFQELLKIATLSERRRYAKVLHSPGDEFNAVFNFTMNNSYMQPHLHPGLEKIEKIHLIHGKVAILFFDDNGIVEKCTILKEAGKDMIQVPAFTWHTYVMLTDYVVTYETMMGVYNPHTWKKMADWAPREGLNESSKYLDSLRMEVEKRLCR